MKYSTNYTLEDRLEDFLMDRPVLTVFIVSAIIIAVLLAVACARVSTGEKQYTGYIYSAEDGIAKTTGHLRFSENAGMDKQPSFCVDKKDGQQIKDLAGSGKKVKVTIPAGFAIAFPWTCPIPATVEVMEKTDE